MNKYKSVNEAFKLCPCLDSTGTTRVWYVKPGMTRDLRMGAEWLAEHGPKIDLSHLEKTHILLGTVKGRNLEEVWVALQGENWSPEMEATDLIESLGLEHTSMSMGDMLQVDGRFYMVDSFGFIEVTPDGFKEIV